MKKISRFVDALIANARCGGLPKSEQLYLTAVSFISLVATFGSQSIINDLYATNLTAN